ncbi:hypothetical protein D3C80_1563550 [compost metagenome]
MLNQWNQSWTCFTINFNRRIQLFKSRGVSTAIYRSNRTDYANLSRLCCTNRRTSTGMNNSDHRNINLGFNIIQRCCCRGITGNDNHFKVILYQIIYNLFCKQAYFLWRSGSVWAPCRISKINNFLSRKLSHDFLGDSKTTYT